MEGEHTPTIIQLILSTDLAVIQLKDSHLFFIFSNNNYMGLKAYLEPNHLRGNHIMLNYLRPNNGKP